MGAVRQAGEAIAGVASQAMAIGGRPAALAALVACLTITSLAPRTFGGSGLHAAPGLPGKLSDREFRSLTDELSEPNGTFRSENFLSNERGYQLVMAEILRR